MNWLIDKAPETVTIDGVEYDINTHFRDCLFTIQRIQDESFTPQEKIEILLHNMYTETPSNGREAVEKALWFLNCGKDNENKSVDKSPAEKLCDFDTDSEYIYRAILKKGIDLQRCGNMHWWTFISHFSEIDESTFSRIVYLRSQSNKGKLSKEERQECQRIGWDIIKMTSESEKSEQKETEDYFESVLRRYE